MVVQHDEIKKLLKGNNLNSTNEWIVYGTKGERGYWIALSDRGVTLLPVAQQGNLTGKIIPFDNQKIKSIALKKSILSNKLIIVDTKNKKHVLKVATRHLVNKHHHEDFLKIIEKYKK